MADAAKKLGNLFSRPTEPVFVPKGMNGVVYDVPEDYVKDRYKPIYFDIQQRFGEDTKDRIQVNKISIPDISIPLQLGRNEQFSLFFPHHRKLAARLIDIFMGMRTVDDFVSAAVYARDRVNPFMFNYALSVAILHRPDTRNLTIPPLTEVFPEKFLDSSIFSRIREELRVVPEGNRTPLEIPQDYTANDLEEEHRLAYFREDLGINLHHWHWHLVYPFTASDRRLVDKDRRGELFYYMHEQIMARYNFERLCNSLARTQRYLNWREPIKEAYFPKLDSLVASRVWAPRPSNAMMQDVNREQEQIKFDIQDLERWRDRMYEAIHTGRVIDNDGKFQDLTESGGIDILGNIMEASDLSINKNVYGDLHNFIHAALGLVHDPDGRHLETFSTIADPATAMRDPVFYRHHAFVNDIFEEWKNVLPAYRVNQLDYSGVRITGFEVTSDGVRNKNEFATFWQQSDVDMSRGVDFAPQGSVFIRATHLQHSPFRYKIQVENNGNNRMGTVRIFLAPKFDERSLPFLFRDQKSLFVELDKFTVTLKPKTNLIERQSKDSAVTIPFEQTFRDLSTNRPTQPGAQLERFNYCGCGWPQHMLLPKGRPEGMPCQLFVMVSNYDDDKIDQDTSGACADAASYCGIRDKKYPDKRSMGYPFDRMPRSGVDTLQQFLTPNMTVIDTTIRFNNRVTPRNS